MKEIEKSEQQLLEEQLQAVTGGCGACANDTLLASQKLHEAGLLRAAAHPINTPDPQERLLKVIQANTLHQEARNLMTGIEQRQQDPNHWNIPHHLHH